MSAGELMTLLIIGVVVVGPKRLPEMMRKAGQYVAKLRRLSTDLRNQSGIDRILREEGLEKEIRELRALRESLSKHALFDSLVAAANKPAPSSISKPAPKTISGGPHTALPAAASPASAPSASSSPTADEAAGAPSDATPPEGETSPPETAEGATVATTSDGTETTSTAASLIKPAPGTVARGAALPSTTAPSAPVNREPYRSFREREYPPYGPDHYEAIPDDIDETDDDLIEAAVSEPMAEAESAR